MPIIGIDCDTEDVVLVYCETCDEEYQIIEGETECPICGNEVELL